MFAQSSFLTEFMSETNLALTQEDHGNKLQDLLTPIRNLLLKERDLLSFSLCRYCGGDTRLAFFTEWYYQTTRLTVDSKTLFEEDRHYFRKKVPLKFRGVPGLWNLIDAHIQDVFEPYQIGILHTKTKEMINELTTKYPHLSKYLSATFLGHITASEMITYKEIYSEELTLSQYIEAQGTRTSFVQIGLPCLLGFSFSFHATDNPINPKAVKWVLLEEVLRNICALHQTGVSKNLEKFIYSSTLSEKEQFEWWQLDQGQQLQRTLASSEARELARQVRDKIYHNAKNILDTLIFPDKYKEMLKDLLEWTYGIG